MTGRPWNAPGRQRASTPDEMRPKRNPAGAGLSSRALCRTRTGDPFLTMEVLYQLS